MFWEIKKGWKLRWGWNFIHLLSDIWCRWCHHNHDHCHCIVSIWLNKFFFQEREHEASESHSGKSGVGETSSILSGPPPGTGSICVPRAISSVPSVPGKKCARSVSQISRSPPPLVLTYFQCLVLIVKWLGASIVKSAFTEIPSLATRNSFAPPLLLPT